MKTPTWPHCSRGIPDDRCQCLHWGVVREGKLVYHYADHDDVIMAGEAYIAPAGHLPEIFAGTEVIEFSPAEKLQQTIEVITKNMESRG